MSIPKKDVCRPSGWFRRVVEGVVGRVTEGWLRDERGYGFEPKPFCWEKPKRFHGVLLGDEQKSAEVLTVFFFEKKSLWCGRNTCSKKLTSIHDHNRHCTMDLDHCSRWYRHIQSQVGISRYGIYIYMGVSKNSGTPKS